MAKRRKFDSKVLEESLRVEANALGYHVGRLVREVARDRAFLEVTDGELDFWQLRSSGFCTVEPASGEHSEIGWSWEGRGRLTSELGISICDIGWDGATFECIRVEFRNFYESSRRHFIVGDDPQLLDRFVKAALDATHLPSDSILVFTHSCFTRSKRLFSAIAASGWDELILAGDLGPRLRDDVRSFLDSRDLYRRYGVPYKRGMLFIGPPGNGKTHCVRALVKEAALPCVYVKSFAARYGEEEANIAKVFARAHAVAPCTLVLEDVDSLVRPPCLSAFLNELDGLASETGILTIATTNHPERLDPALLERPSRFDRKYHFGLPALAERRRYLAYWNERLEAVMKPGDSVEILAERTETMSFAFLKELVISSMARWMTERKPGSMGDVMLAELDALRATWRPFDEGDVPREKEPESKP